MKLNTAKKTDRRRSGTVHDVRNGRSYGVC